MTAELCLSLQPKRHSLSLIRLFLLGRVHPFSGLRFKRDRFPLVQSRALHPIGHLPYVLRVPLHKRPEFRVLHLRSLFITHFELHPDNSALTASRSVSEIRNVLLRINNLRGFYICELSVSC